VKKLSLRQAYSHLYNKKKIRPTIQAMWNKHVEVHPEDKVGNMIPIEWRNRKVADLFKQESDAVKDEVKAWRNEHNGESEDELDPDDVQEEEGIDDKEKQRQARAVAFQR
jgi:gas vesicle protein